MYIQSLEGSSTARSGSVPYSRQTPGDSRPAARDLALDDQGLGAQRWTLATAGGHGGFMTVTVRASTLVISAALMMTLTAGSATAHPYGGGAHHPPPTTKRDDKH